MAKKTYILDTHCLIWFQENNPKIPARVMQIIQDVENKICFSQVSLFEIAIKKAIGKLPDFVGSINDLYDAAIKDDFSFLPIDNSHINAYESVPLFNEHRDPFDRLIIATAINEDMVILSADSNFKLYDAFVKIEW